MYEAIVCDPKPRYDETVILHKFPYIMATQITHQTPLLTYTYLEAEQIHSIQFHKASRAAYDEFIALMNTIYSELTSEMRVRLLIDYRSSGIPPITYIITRGVAWSRSLSVHPEARMAIVTRPDSIARMFRSMVSTVRLGHLSTSIFEGDAGYTAALAWLQR